MLGPLGWLLLLAAAAVRGEQAARPYDPVVWVELHQGGSQVEWWVRVCTASGRHYGDRYRLTLA